MMNKLTLIAGMGNNHCCAVFCDLATHPKCPAYV
jgi:hypothetical protein